jgi:hypothetical protein
MPNVFGSFHRDQLATSVGIALMQLRYRTQQGRTAVKRIFGESGRSDQGDERCKRSNYLNFHDVVSY